MPVTGAAPRSLDAGDAAPAAALLAQAGFRGWTAEALRAQPSRGWVFVAGAWGAPTGVVVGAAAVDDAELVALAVCPEARRRGVGRGLVRALMAAAAEDAMRMVLEVRPSNVAARALYAELGFVPVGRRPRFYGDEEALLLAADLKTSGGPDGRRDIGR